MEESLAWEAEEGSDIYRRRSQGKRGEKNWEKKYREKGQVHVYELKVYKSIASETISCHQHVPKVVSESCRHGHFSFRKYFLKFKIPIHEFLHE